MHLPIWSFLGHQISRKMWVYCSKSRGGRQWDWEAGSPDLQGQKNLGGCPAQRTAEGGVRDVLSCSSAALRRMEQPACHFHRRWDTKLCCQLQGKVISSSFRKQNIQAAGTAEPEGIGITPPPLERLKEEIRQTSILNNQPWGMEMEQISLPGLFSGFPFANWLFK